jgi:bla regulator protein BlaR1
MMDFFGNHLWQSTLFATVAALFSLFFRKNHARIRYWLWLVASIKFLIPFSLFITIGSYIDFSWQQSASLPQTTISYVENISQPFGSIATSPAISGTLKQDRPHWIPVFLYAIWFCGFMTVLSLYMTRGSRLKKAERRAQPLTNGSAYGVLQALEISNGLKKRIKLVSSTSSMEPGVFGIFRPVLLLPEGMTERLNDSELEAIIAHEVVHVRRHDNLIATVHMVIEALFWFHPMVWWLGTKLVQERERACDEEVLKLVKNPQSYAEGILKVCEFYLESPLACVAGVTGADMKKRIQAIMAHRIGSKLNLGKKLLLAMAGVVALSFPVIIGLLNTPSSRAQSQTGSKPSFEVASVKTATDCGNVASGVSLKIPGGPSYQPGGRFTTCSQLKYIIMDAYSIDAMSPVKGVPDWSNDILYKIEAKAEGNPDKEQMRLMVQSLLEERFKLKMHREMRESPVYLLVVAKGGHKLKPAKDEKGNPIISLPPPDPNKQKAIAKLAGETVTLSEIMSLMGPGSYSIGGHADGRQLTAKAMSMERLAKALYSTMYRTSRRKVIDNTDLTGLYEIQLTFADPLNRQAIPETDGSAPTAELATPTIFNALQEQLGLKLEADKAPVEYFIIDSVDRPSEN